MISYLGFIILGISSLAVDPWSSDLWIRPKLVMMLVGLTLIAIPSILKLKKLPELNKQGLILFIFSIFLVCHAFFFQYSFLQLAYLFPLFFLASLAFLLNEKKFDSDFLDWVFLIQSIVAIAQFFFFDVFHLQMMGEALKWRTLGFIGNPNQLGLFLAFYFLRPSKNKWISLIVGLAFILTFSRGAFLALAVALLLGNHLSEWKSTAKKFAVLIFAVVLVEIFYGQTGIVNLDSITGRAASYLNFPKPQNVLFGSASWDLQSPVHNQFLFAIECFGLVGLVLLIGFFWNLFKDDKKVALLLISFSMYDLPFVNPAVVSLILISSLSNFKHAEEF